MPGSFMDQRWRGREANSKMSLLQTSCWGWQASQAGGCGFTFTVISWVVWNEYLLSYQQTKMLHLSAIPAPPDVNSWATPVSSVGEGFTICHTKNLRMSQSFTGGAESAYLPGGRPLCDAYNNKAGKIRIKVTEQIHCEFKINPSRYIRTLITSLTHPHDQF